MEIDDQPASLDATFTTPNQFLEDKTADLNIAMSVGENRGDLTLALGDGLTFDGTVDVDFPALRDLLGLIGTRIDSPKGFNTLRVKGALSGSPSKIAFGRDTKIQFDDIAGSGDITLDLDGPRPKVTGSLAATTVDLRPYLPAEAEGKKALKDGTSDQFPEWSTAPMDLSALSIMDSDLRVAAEAVTLPSLKLSNVAMKVDLSNGSATAQIDNMKLYDGSGSGTITANTRGNAASLTANVALSDVEVGTLVYELFGVDRLKGKGDVALNVRAQGNSQAALVGSLNGTTNANIAEGRLAGVNLGKIVRGTFDTVDTLLSGGLGAITEGDYARRMMSTAQGADQDTDFSSMAVDLLIENGVAKARKLEINAPYMAINGTGTVNLPAQTFYIQLNPAVTSVETGTERRLPIPIKISGTFNAPTYGIDTQALLRQQASRLLGQNGNKLDPQKSLGENARDLLRQEAEKRLGLHEDKHDEAGDTPEEAQADSRPEDVLKRELLNLVIGGDEDQADNPDDQ